MAMYKEQFDSMKSRARDIENDAKAIQELDLAAEDSPRLLFYYIKKIELTCLELAKAEANLW